MGVVRRVEELDNTDYAFPDAYEMSLLHGVDPSRDFDRAREAHRTLARLAFPLSVDTSRLTDAGDTEETQGSPRRLRRR